MDSVTLSISENRQTLAGAADPLLASFANGTSAKIFLHGAHVTSWKASDGEEILFVSKQAIFKPPKAIRGGIPLCFPQFGKLGPLGQHGFARNSAFTVTSQSDTSATLTFKPTQEQLEDAKFPHPFELKVTVKIASDGTSGDSLTQKLEAVNLGKEDFELTAALHTYFNVSSIDQVKVLGLEGLKFLDNTQDMKAGQETAPAVTFSGELDRIYVETPDSLQIVDQGRQRQITLHKQGLPDAVVWNPWADKAKGMADFADDEYRVMVCLEPALAASGPVILKPNQRWAAQQVLSVQKLLSKLC